MRQYIEGWITECDMTGDVTRIVEEETASNYAEDESLPAPSANEPD
jgi:hypothetical protein